MINEIIVKMVCIHVALYWDCTPIAYPDSISKNYKLES